MDIIGENYASEADAREDICDTLMDEERFRNLFGPEQLVFLDWAIAHANEYDAGSDGVDWVGAFYDWVEE